MPLCFKQTHDTECPYCRGRFTAEVWIIVDSAERPDLWCRCRDDDINAVTCPRGHRVELDAPLLLHDSARKRVLFLPVPGMTKDQVRQLATALVARVQDALPQAARGQYLAQVKIIDRRELASELDERLCSVLQELGRLTAAADCPRRIQLCEEALREIDPRGNPLKWARLQLESGNALLQDASDRRANSIERALRAYEAAVTIYTREEFPLYWARTQFGMGNAYQDRMYSDRAENLESAIEAYHAALAIYTREAFPTQWALLQNNLGNAYWKRVLKERAQNLEDAIEAFEAALCVRTRDSYPLDWGMTQNNLGNVCRDRIRGVRADNIEKAIELFQAALEVYTRDAFPDQWALAQNNLGIAYLLRIRGDRRESLESAIDAFRAALSVFDRDRSWEHWGMAKHNLGNAFFERIEGDRAENLERSIDAFTDALSVHIREAMPADWAMTQHSLANAYRERIRGDRADNVETAIAAYEAALSIYTRETFPHDWAMVQTNLANARRVRIQGEHSENIELAISAYEAALTVHTQEAWPHLWAGIQTNLGNAYADRLRGGRTENIERAIQAFEAACSVHTREAFPEEWANTQNNLGAAYCQCGRNSRGDNLTRAVQSYQAALTVFSADKFPEKARGTSWNLAQVEIERRNWQAAYSALLSAVGAAERLYTATLSEESKVAERKASGNLYAQMVDVCLQLDPPRVLEAFSYAEEGHTRILTAKLASLKIPSPPHVPPELIAQEAQLLQDLRGLENWIRDAPNAAMRRHWVEHAATERGKLDRLWAALARDYGAVEYVEQRGPGKLSWDDVQARLTAQERRVVLLEFFALPDRLLAFIARAGENQPRVVSLGLSAKRLLDFTFRFHFEVRHRFDEFGDREIQETWRNLGHVLLPNVMADLGYADLVCIVPHAFLHELPLHALEYQGKPLIEHFPIVYAPSAAAAIRGDQASPSPVKEADGNCNRTQTLVVGNPTGDLDLAEEEAQEVAKRFKVEALLCAEATKERVLSQLVGARRAHFAAHAYFDARDPLKSGIRLAWADVLTARDILTRPLNLELLVTSGCETAAQDIQPGDERAGLTHAFLAAGVSSLVLSMWDVRGDVGKALMIRFYDHLYDDEGTKRASTADALRAVMLETRKEYDHTYHWAPFVLYGCWQ